MRARARGKGTGGASVVSVCPDVQVKARDSEDWNNQGGCSKNRLRLVREEQQSSTRSTNTKRQLSPNNPLVQHKGNGRSQYQK